MTARHKKITIYQVADEAGVAISTVSRVLNNSPNVSEPTKMKVQEAIKRLNFRPQVNARNLASRKPQMLAVAVPSFTTPFYNEILKGVKDQIQEMDLDIIIYNTGSRDPESAVADFFDRGTTDALIVISIELRESVHRQIQASAVPTVLVGSSHPDYNYYELNDREGGFMAGEHLIRQAFTRPGMILPVLETRVSMDRKNGFIAALKANDVEIDEKLFVRGESTKHAGFTEEAGYEAILHFREIGEFPDAIFCINDTQAIGALHAIRELGMKVPDDVALMGYDNIKLTRYLDLTTLDQQMHRVGQLATQRLSQLISDPDSTLEQVVMQPSLIERGSTRRVTKDP